MDIGKIAREMASLPPEAQKEIVDFLAFLKTRYPSSSATKSEKRGKLAEEPFIGMWQDRRDMQDSTAWVRKLRQWERAR